jgi:hypothetical protein
MAVVLANPQSVTKRSVPIYGKPVMVVIDVSGSMAYVERYPEKEGVAEEISDSEKARRVFDDILSRDLGVDFGLLLYSTENYIARYFASQKNLLKDTLENKEEIYFISTATRTAAALARAHRFFSENIVAKDKAILLISDLKGDRDAMEETADEMERALRAGIKIYVIIIESEKQGMVGARPRLPEIRGVKIAGMNDEYGIVEICQAIAAMELSQIREDEILLRKSLIPFLIPPILGLVVLCLILSETRFRKIP